MSYSVPIPKFSSFKPKEVGENVVDTPTPTDASEHGGLQSKKRKHHHRRHRSRSHEKSSKRPDDEGSLVHNPVNDTKELFIEDRRGDRQNLVYGTIHRYSIPIFHRIGAGAVLGAKPVLRIDRNFPEDKGIVLSERRNENRGEREKYVFARNERKAPRLLRIRRDLVEDVAAASNSDFIAFKGSKPRKRSDLGSEPIESSDEEKRHYRSIEGKAKVVAEPSEDGFEWTSDSSDPGTGRTIKFDEALREENIKLSRRVDEHPEDIEAWIALINHQDNLLGWADEGRRKVTAAERRSTADIKLHMYEKAILKSGSIFANRERLLLGLMAEGAKIWDFKTQSERWEHVSQDNLESVLLWKEYLNFRQSSFVAFRFEEVRAIFVRRIALLRLAINKAERAGTETGRLFEHLIYTILRATLYIHEAGYSENAIAIWQALLEFNFLGHQSPPSSRSRLDNFQEFWDSEVPRIGEDGAKGWKNFEEDAEAPPPKLDDDLPQKHIETEDIFASWIAAEKCRTATSKMPARTVDETTEDDPYRVILWSDVEDFMFDLTSSSCKKEGSRLLLDAFLIFCRIPPVPSSENHASRQWWIDSYSRGELVDCNLNWIHMHFMEPSSVRNNIINESSAFESLRNSEILDPLDWPLQYFAGSSDTLFGLGYWERYLRSWRDTYADPGLQKRQENGQDSASDPPKDPDEIESQVPYSWLRKCLKSLANSIRDDLFTEYYLAFEFCNEPQDIKKIAKSLLKQNPHSLRLYNAYAMIERRRANSDISTNIIMTALGMQASLPQDEQQWSILLWKNWVWTLIEEKDFGKALRCLCNVADGLPSNMDETNVVSPVTLLKAKQHLSSICNFSISSRDMYRTAIYVECLALLEYLSSSSEYQTSSNMQGDISSALSVFGKFMDKLVALDKHSNNPLELMLQSAARLMYFHASSGPFRPALLREHLTKYLTLFPRNTIILSIYSWNESRLRIDDRVRVMLRSTILTEVNDNIISRLFAIRFEMRSGNIHSTVAACESAVSSISCRSNAGLWRYYVLICADSKEFRHKTRDVFFRAIRVCPWSKNLMMMAFLEVLGLGIKDKIAVYKVLVEKELRIHVNIEQKIEDWYG